MRLIDAEALKETVRKCFADSSVRYTVDGTPLLTMAYDAVNWFIDKEPTIDAVPVTRCEDCKHCMIFSMFTSKWYVCCRNEKGVDVNADDFCSKAERGNDETN